MLPDILVVAHTSIIIITDAQSEPLVSHNLQDRCQKQAK
jgi:hypothetical protein